MPVPSVSKVYPSITSPKPASIATNSHEFIVSSSTPPSSSRIEPPTATFGPSSTSGEPVRPLGGETTIDGTVFVVYTSSSVSPTTSIKSSTFSSSVPATPTGATDTSLTQTELQIGSIFTRFDYFYAMYLPILLAVFFKSVWVVVFASTKMMEPFHQLSKQRGATAEDTLFADYLSTGLSLSSVKAIFQSHWVMALTTGVYVLFALLPPLASEGMTVKFVAKCPSSMGMVPCEPAWMVNVTVLKVIEAILGTMAAMVVVLLVLQWKRKSGVMSDPSSLASMASLLHHPDVLADFREIDPMAKADELQNLLAGNQYVLKTYESIPGQFRYGLIKTVATVKIRGSAALSSTRYQALSNPSNHETMSNSRSIPWGAIRDSALGLCLLGLLGVCIGYYRDGKSDPFNNFFNSDTFGPRFILVIAATVVDYQWKRIEREVRIMEPFRRLGRRRASPRRTILPSRNGTPISALFPALWNMNFFVAAIASIAILSDILIISIAGVPFSSAEIRPASLASFYTSFGILGIMLIALIAVLIWRRSNPTMPRTPDTLASVWTYLCASHMLEDFDGMEFLSEAVRDKVIRDSGRKYFYGMATGSDGRDRYMVDHETSGGTVQYTY